MVMLEMSEGVGGEGVGRQPRETRGMDEIGSRVRGEDCHWMMGM